MEPYSRFLSEVVNARDRAHQLRREAEEQRLIQQLVVTPSRPFQRRPQWRSRLAAQLHALAERLESQPDPKESRL